MDAEVWMQAVRRRPGAEPHSRRGFAGAPGRAKRQHVAIDQDLMPVRDQAFAADLAPLNRRIDEAGGTSRRRLLAQDVPRLERVADFQAHATGLDPSGHRATQLEERAIDLGGMCQATGGEELQHVLEVAPDPRRQQEPVVQGKTPAHQRRPVRFLGQGGDQRANELRLRDHHPRMRRHLERAQLDQALASVGRAPVEELVDADLGPVRVAGDVHQQMTEEAIAQPGRRALAGWLREGACERDLQLVERVVAGLVDARRLRGGTDEEAAEQVRERGMVLDEGEQAGQQRRVLHEGAAQRRRTPEREMVAASASGLASVEQILLGMQPRVQGRCEHVLQQLRVRVESGRGRQVDLQHAGIGSQRETGQIRAARRGVPFEQYRNVQRRPCFIDRCDHAQEVLCRGDRREEDVDGGAARLDAQGGAHRFRRGRRLLGRRRTSLWHAIRG